ncbi:hypothetical protein [Thermus phage P23-45]|uniref:Uncharacterized protein n=1 Tax=Thermus virus P23-45 TaxID=2914006 RepID=A7XXF2_BP234|nr:hypothetical protein P23p115 [Thermus phage P23-45]ABU96948.1 hypothetical protein P23p115 [Thermus phage P23-45]UYB98476.1 hypothetical protein [Thermus phage P23-45]
MPYRFTRIPIPSTVSTTTVRPFADAVARATGWVDEAEISAAVVHVNSGSTILYRYKTRYFIDGQRQIELIIGLSGGSSPVQIAFGFYVNGNPPYQQYIVVYRWSVNTSAIVEALVYAEDMFVTLGYYLGQSVSIPMPIFAFIEKLTMDVVEGETVLPLYLGYLGTSGNVMAGRLTADSQGFMSAYAGIVVPSAIGFSTSFLSRREQSSLLTAFGPVYLVKPYGLGLKKLPDSIRYAQIATNPGSILNGSVTTTPFSIPLSATEQVSVNGFTFIATPN